MKFVHDVKNALVGQDYVGDFGERTFWQAAKFLLILAILESLVVIIVFCVHLYPTVSSIIYGEKIQEIVKENISEDIKINIVDGEVAVEGEEPVVITLDPKILSNKLLGKLDDEKGENDEENESAKDEKREMVLVVDTTVADPVAYYEENGLDILVTKDYILMQGDNSDIRITKVESVVDEDLEITQESIINLIDETKPLAITLLTLVPILALIVFSLLTWARFLIVTILLALVTLLIARLSKIKISYKSAYVISAFALALPILVDAVTDIFLYNLNFFVGFVLFIVAVVANLKKKKD